MLERALKAGWLFVCLWLLSLCAAVAAPPAVAKGRVLAREIVPILAGDHAADLSLVVTQVEGGALPVVTVDFFREGEEKTVSSFKLEAKFWGGIVGLTDRGVVLRWSVGSADVVEVYEVQGRVVRRVLEIDSTCMPIVGDIDLDGNVEVVVGQGKEHVGHSVLPRTLAVYRRAGKDYERIADVPRAEWVRTTTSLVMQP